MGNNTCEFIILNPCSATKEATAMRSQSTATRKEPPLSATRENLHGNEGPAPPKT